MQADQEAVMSSGSFKKRISESAEAMMMRHMQANQYMYPQRSMIRELVSNAVDATTAKQIARKILAGEPAENYYVHRTEPEFADSNWDPSYYDLNWLSDDDRVIISYEDGGELGKDKIVIEDEGVGLGGKKLQRYFELGWSDKRNNTTLLGKYGVGAKSAFSTGVDNYVMISRYNGQEFRFNIYLRAYQSMVPKFNTGTGKINGHVLFEGDEGPVPVYYTDTTEKNGVTIIVETKKHHKHMYIDAVKSQLLYFDNIVFKIQPHNGPYSIIPVKADIIYEDDVMVLSNNNQMSKPHMLINKVNYGLVDFKELELEEVNGNIGIKVDADTVEVSPSRESVVWKDTTKEAVKAAFEKVVEKAGEFVSKELNQTDFLTWIKACISVSSMFASGDSVVSRLAKIIDMKRVSPAFTPNRAITYGYSLMVLLSVQRVMYGYEVDKNKRYRKIERGGTMMDNLLELPLVIRQDASNTRKNKYLLDKVYPQGFLEIRPNREAWVTLAKEVKADVLEKLGMEKDSVKTESVHGRVYTRKVYDVRSDTNEQALQQYNDMVISHLLASKSGYALYEEIVVPEDYKTSENELEEVHEEQNVVEKQEDAAAFESMKERRKKEGKTVLFTFRSMDRLDNATAGDPLPRALELHKLEPKFSDIDSWKAEEIFVGNKADESMLHMAAMITRPANGRLTSMEVPVPDAMKPWINNAIVQQPMTYFTGIPNPKFDPAVYLGTSYDSSTGAAISYTHVPDCIKAPWFFQNTKIKLLQVAKENVKYYRDFKNIKQFFMDLRGKTLTMSNALIKWNTARMMHAKFQKLKFLNGFKLINPTRYQEYMKLKEYMETNYREMEQHQDKFFGNSSQEFQNLTGYLNKVWDFQEFVRRNKDDAEAIAAVAQQYFAPQKGMEIDDAKAVDTDIYDTFTDLLEFAEPFEVLLNSIPALTGQFTQTKQDMSDYKVPAITPDLEEQITFYMKAKMGL